MRELQQGRNMESSQLRWTCDDRFMPTQGTLCGFFEDHDSGVTRLIETRRDGDWLNSIAVADEGRRRA